MRRLLALILLLISTLATAQVTFHDGFDSASLGVVEQLKGENVYCITKREDPQNPLDTAAFRSNRWFYFLLCGASSQSISIDIPHTDMGRGVYSYDGKEFVRFSEDEQPQLNGRITKHFTHDSVYIAYCTPYPLTRHYAQLERWSKASCVRRFSLGESGTGRDIDALIITDNPHKGLVIDQSGNITPRKEDLKKRVVYIHGRIHPSETPSSWHLEALIDRIIEDESGALQNTIFYIIPFINPDGVYQGWSRTDSVGVNLENNYNDTAEQTQSEVRAVKRLLLALQEAELEPSIALNMHSQSAPKLTYWVHNAASTSPRHMSRSMLFAALSIDSNPLFQWGNLSYSSLKDRFIEGWIYHQFRGRTLALTFETPYSYYDLNPNGEWVNIENLSRQAQYTLNAITDILGVGTIDRITVDEPTRTRGFKRVKGGEYIHHGKGHLLARKSGKTIHYHRDSIARGEYNVYRWIVAKNSRHKRYDTGRWLLIGEHKQLSDGEFNYTLHSNNAGERFDRLLLRLK